MAFFAQRCNEHLSTSITQYTVGRKSCSFLQFLYRHAFPEFYEVVCSGPCFVQSLRYPNAALFSDATD